MQSVKAVSTYIHEGVSVYQGFLHLYQLDIIVSKRKAIPKDVAFSSLPGLTIAKLANDILYSVHLISTVGGVDHDVLSPAVGRLHHTGDVRCVSRGHCGHSFLANGHVTILDFLIFIIYSILGG